MKNFLWITYFVHFELFQAAKPGPNDLVCDQPNCYFELAIKEQLVSTAIYGNQRFPIKFDEDGEIQLSSNRFYDPKTVDIFAGTQFWTKQWNATNNETENRLRNLTIEDYKNVIFGAGENQENGSSKTVVTINGQNPGPKIVVPENSKVAIKVINSMWEKSTSLHWHGLSMENSWYYDGSSVSQCPIVSGTSFTYRFLAKPRGVHWYHAHFNGQLMDGLFGLFVVVPEKSEINSLDVIENNLNLADVTPIMISEHDRMPSSIFYNEFIYLGDGSKSITKDVHQRFFRYDGTELNAVNFDAVMVNGRGRRSFETDNIPFEVIFHDFSVDQNGNNHDKFSVETTSNNLLVFLNSGSDWAHEVSVDGHRIQIIEIDGSPISPRTVDFIQISPGERYVVRLQKNQNEKESEGDMFMIKVEPVGFYTYSGTDSTDPIEGLLEPSTEWLELMKTAKWWGQFLETANATTGGHFRRLNQYEKRDKSAFMVYSYKNNTVENRKLGQKFADNFVKNDYVMSDTSASRCHQSNACDILNCDFGEYFGSDRDFFKCVVISELQSVKDENPVDYSEIYQRILDGQTVPVVQSFMVGSNINGNRFAKPIPPLTAPGSTPKECGQPGFGNFCQSVSQPYQVNSKHLMLLYSTGAAGFYRTFDPHHNFHIHGHKMRILAQGYGKQTEHGVLSEIESNEEIIVIKTKASHGVDIVSGVKFNNTFIQSQEFYQRLNPNGIFRDVVTVPNLGWVLVEVNFKNPGLFHAHCHMMSHSMEGMGMILRVENENGKIPFPPRDIDFPTCGNFEPGTSDDDFEKFMNYQESFPRPVKEERQPITYGPFLQFLQKMVKIQRDRENKDW